jgi:hypothetical protein
MVPDKVSYRGMMNNAIGGPHIFLNGSTVIISKSINILAGPVARKRSHFRFRLEGRL